MVDFERGWDCERVEKGATRLRWRWRQAKSIVFPCALAFGCGASPSSSETEDQGHSRAVIAESTSELSQALQVTTFQDDTSPRIHVQVKACRSGTAQAHQTVDCTLDSGYAIVGGGGFAQFSGSGGLLVQSQSAGDRTWRASSKDHVYPDPHFLTTYAVGLRLDGVNAATLRNRLHSVSNTAPGLFTLASVTIGAPGIGLGGTAETSSDTMLLTQSSPTETGGWAAVAKDHLLSGPASVSAGMLFIDPVVIEGFGTIETQSRFGQIATVATGVATARGVVDPGWALVGYGGKATWTNGSAGRLLFRLGLDVDARGVVTESKDHGEVSGGDTQVSWKQVRWRSGTHGLCNPNPKLPIDTDACVTKICNADSFCCSTAWDSICVGEVTSICGRSCADFTCSLPSYNPGFWNQGNVQLDNSGYNYATNKKTDTFAQPGRASGESCAGSSCSEATVLGKYAANDGLIPVNPEELCADGRARLALATAPGVGSRWYRLDSNGKWSYKTATSAVSNLDDSGQLIGDPLTASRGIYSVFGGYFCACSSWSEGQGHSVIN
jgi:hypothetical protein